METIVSRLFDLGVRRPLAPALFEKKGGSWRAQTYRGYAETVQSVGRALLSIGFLPGDTVALLGFNRPEWAYLALGAMAAGGAAAGIYVTSSESEIEYIAGHAGSKVLLLENVHQWTKVLPALDRLKNLKHVVFMRGVSVDHPLALTWEEFLDKATSVDLSELMGRVHALEPGGLASLIYTSGTTGPPKGVMLSHGNLTFTADIAAQMTLGGAGDSLLSYLPLSHIAEQMFSIHAPITIGCSVYFAESLEKVPENLKEIQPTIFFGVPRIWEKFHAGIAAKLTQATGAKRPLVDWARRVGKKVADLRMVGKEPSGLLALEYAAATRLVFSKLKPAVGMGRARFCVSGAAPIAKEVLEFFASLDLIVHEVYGQSEDCGPTTCNLPGRTRLGTVGPLLPGIEVRLADDGEILVRGKNVFLGYYKEPEATAEALRDGWLYSGDLGSFDAEGFLSITGRKKEILITAGGKNIAPKNIEAAIKQNPLVSEAVVIGDRRKFLTALITLEPDRVAELAAELRIDPRSAFTEPRVLERIQATLDDVNRDLAQVETVKKFTLLGRPFSLEEGELTPTLKLKRRVIESHFSSQIEAMYEG